MSSMAQVRRNVWRINTPQTNSALTRTNGHPSKALCARIAKAIGSDRFYLRKGRTSNHWYVRSTS